MSYTAPPPYESSTRGHFNPATHPNSSFRRLQQERIGTNPGDLGQQRLDFNNQLSPVSPLESSPVPPRSPAHHATQELFWPQEQYNLDPNFTTSTPGADNFGHFAGGGGMAGIALGVASAKARESGLEAMTNVQRPGQQRGVELQDYPETMPFNRSVPRDGGLPSPTLPFGAAAAPLAAPLASPTQNYSSNGYSAGPYNRQSHHFDSHEIDPSNIEDDGDDGLEYPSNRGGGASSRASMLSGAGMAGSAGVLGAAGKAAVASTSHLRGGSPPNYAPVPNGAPDGNTAYPGHTMADMGWTAEKKEWLRKEKNQNKKRMWLVIGITALVVIGVIVGGVVGGVVGTGHKNSTQDTAANDLSKNGDLDKNSPEIKALMNNNALHKVFPGFDYTPLNAQYPDCMTAPPSQNNITRDLAVLSQLTNVVRLYGTDCNQTEMLLHSIDALGLNDTIKVWLGVWQGTNDTTNTRQLDQMYNILDTYGTKPFLGIIIGNEVLFRDDMSGADLGTLIQGVRTNLAGKGLSLPLATSDLGDAWAKAPMSLVESVEYIMSNIHPFFAGVNVQDAAGWTISFWNNWDTPLANEASNKPKNIISETGWPSAGGMDCGDADTCTNGSVAGINEMNTFMDTFVCQALANGTEYFWFEAFDEPWKIIYDTPGKEWEDKWGLMDINRELKDGVIIPDCGGKTVDS